MSVFMLCERALGLVRGSRLSDLETSQRTMLEALNYEGLANSHAQEEAVTCVRHFAAVRDGLFHTYPWVFARKATLLTSAATPLYGWIYAYNLPTDCVKLLQLVLPHRTTPKYEQIGSVVACDYSSVSARYTARITDTDQWPMLYQDAFCVKLAGEISFAVRGVDGAPIQWLIQQFQTTISEGYRTGIIDPGLSIDNNLTPMTKNTTQLLSPTPEMMGGHETKEQDA
jgi:hypothetical protein